MSDDIVFNSNDSLNYLITGYKKRRRTERVVSAIF